MPDAELPSDGWSLSHLLLDHRAIPTLMEVKRSSDTRIRREVIGQMLDYAANATRYWPKDRIRTLAAAQAGGVDQLDAQVADFLAVPSDPRMVDENRRAGRLHLLFVADELPREVRRVFEFLNEHMPKIEVLGWRSVPVRAARCAFSCRAWSGRPSVRGTRRGSRRPTEVLSKVVDLS